MQCKKIANFIIFIVAMLHTISITFLEDFRKLFLKETESDALETTAISMKHIFKGEKIEKQLFLKFLKR